jgi:hypothetical protein
MPSTPVEQSRNANEAAQRAIENANQAAQIARENASQARDVARETANRAAREAIRRPRDLPRPSSRRGRRPQSQQPNFNLLEHSPKYTLDSYLFLRRDEINIKLDSYDEKIDNLSYTIRGLERDLSDLNKSIYAKIQIIKKYEQEKDSLLKFSQNITTTLTNGNLPSCTVCLGDIPKNNVAITNCRHLFCKNCIAAALSFSNRCPVCRCNVHPRTISIINLEDQTTIITSNECTNSNEVNEPIDIIDEVIEDDEKEHSPIPIIRTPPPPPRRPAPQNSYEYNIQGTTRFSRGAGNSIRSRTSRGAGNSPGENGNSPRIIRPRSSRGRGNASPRGRGGNQGVSRNTNPNNSNNRRPPISPTRRIDYEQYRNLSQIDDRSINNSREYGNNVGIGSGWIPVPNDNPRIYRRNNQLPPINPADYGSNQQNREERVSNNRPYSTYINQPTVDQYRRNRNYSNIVPSEHGYTSRRS